MNRTISSLFNLENSLFRYILGTAAMTVALQFLYDFAVAQLGDWEAGLLLTGILMIAVFLVIWLDRVRARRAAISLMPEEQPIQPHRGLILLVSPGNLEVPLLAAEHHAARLEHCWLIYTPASWPTANQLESEIRKRWPNIQTHEGHEFQVAPEDIKNTWQVVEQIFSKEVFSHGLQPADVVADITGGLKPMTAGMALACISPDRNMQYVKTPRDDTGKPIPDTPRVPVLITTQQT